MLPIPVPIIGSNKRLFIPLLYLVVTASICYLFLIAFVGVSSVNNNNHQLQPQPSTFTSTINRNQNQAYTKIKINESNLRSLKNSNIFSVENQSPIQIQSPAQSYYISDERTTERKEREVQGPAPIEEDQSSVINNISDLRSKNDYSKENYSQQNGTRRSDSPEIRLGHQDDRWVDEQAVVHYPWPEDDQCKHLTVRFAKKKTFKPRALVSFPGSGNSWLRYLIDCSTGIFTGSVYNDKGLFKNGLFGEMRQPNDGSTIVQKTHHDTIYRTTPWNRKAYVKLTELMFGYRGILLIRNPHDALLSYWNFMMTRNHKGHVDTNFSDIRWINYVTEEVSKWSSLITSWVENSMDLLIVQYEELKKNPRDELTRILQYLDQPVNSERLDCLLKKEHIEGPFLRNHQYTTPEKSLRNSSESQESIFSNNNHPPSLDLIVQDNIDKINLFFLQKGISIHLNYTGRSIRSNTTPAPPDKSSPTPGLLFPAPNARTTITITLPNHPQPLL